MLGRPRTELIGNSLAHVAAPVARVVERLILERTLRSESVVIDLPAGGSVTMELSARIVETRAGRQAIAIARDVSERSRLESQLHQAQKMEAVGRLTGGIAHDFNNVLAIILAHASFLLGDLPADDPRHADAKEIRQAAERAAALTRQLLAFSRKQVLEPVVLDMNVHVAEMAKLLPRVLGPSIELATALSADLGSVRVDPIQLEQVVMNLAINAKDAMPAGGRLLLETSNAELDEGFSQTHPVTPGPYVLLCVSDTGVGMDAETQRHLFEPFFTTKERGKGTGLGLSTCYGIVKQSGGYIWAYSEVGSGTTFKIYLPRVGDPPGAPAAAALLHTLAGTEKVLVVDDDEKVRALASRILKTHGYHVLEAEDVAPAIGRSADESGTIDLLVADVLMPGGSGLDLALRLRASRPHMRVLLISGYTEQGLPRERMLEIRAAFLQKPFSPDALARKVREVLDA